MTTPSRPGIVLALGLMIPAGIASATMEEHIGTWVLSCPAAAPGAEPCQLHIQKRLLDTAGITGDLEVQALGSILVPVIALHGLSNEIMLAASLAGKAEVSMQFAGGPREDLVCAPSSLGYICSPKGDAAQELAAGLVSARSVTVRASVVVSGLKPLPVQEKSLHLSGTNEALARLRAVGPTQMPGLLVPGLMTVLAAQSPGGLMAMADKALKAAGYSNGMADLQALLAKYRGKQSNTNPQ
jgi:hypothetical protein